MKRAIQAFWLVFIILASSYGTLRYFGIDLNSSQQENAPAYRAIALEKSPRFKFDSKRFASAEQKETSEESSK